MAMAETLNTLKFGELSVGGSHSESLQDERTATTGDKPTTSGAKPNIWGTG